MAHMNPKAEMNLAALERISAYLTRCPRLIEVEDVRELTAVGVDEKEAVVQLLLAACGVEEERGGAHRELARGYFAPGLAHVDERVITHNAYVRAIRFPQAQLGRWTMTQLHYAPYELFVRDDLLILPDGREIPQLGYFDREVAYPAVLQDGREWMTVTPNEIATMEKAIARAHGRVCAMGLGLGYFAFMAAGKPEVSCVTVVERDREVISLFESHILPQMACREKIRIVQADAFDYVRKRMAADGTDYAFVDLWHDVSDGAPMYLSMKALESCAPGTEFVYWIETSIRAFLRSLSGE